MAVTFQLAEVAVPRDLFRKILRRIDDLRPRPVPTLAERIDGKVKSTGEVCLDGGKYRKMAFRLRPIRFAPLIVENNHPLGGA
jgi:hypothetical protein